MQELELEHFRVIMRRQLKRYTQRRLSDALHLRRCGAAACLWGMLSHALDPTVHFFIHPSVRQSARPCTPDIPYIR
jgi:hypothetical protein